MASRLAADDVDLVRDRALVERAQEGDVDAFTELYTRYFRRLVRFSAKRVGDVHEAEEIAQEAFVRAYRALPTFAGERRFYPWITVIASRLCVDALRRRGRVEIGDVGDREFVEVGFDRLDIEGDLLTLHQAMGRLTGRHREVLDLRERQGWSYQHIADHYQVSLGTVEALLWRARKALRREFTALCSAVAAVPILRRLTYSTEATGPSAMGAIGCVGTAFALSVGFSGAPVQPAVLAPAAISSPVTALTVSVAGASPVTATPTPAASTPPTTTAAGPRAADGQSASNAARRNATAQPSQVLPQTRLVPAGEAATEARQEPLVVGIGPFSAIGVDPGIPVPPLNIQIGRKQ